MSIVTKIAPSADLMTGMIDRLGKQAVDPREVATQAHARMLRTMVFRCLACPDQPGCAALQGTCQHLDEPPACCPNRGVLMELADA